MKREWIGIEPTQQSPNKMALSGEGGAESGALASDPELALVVAAWPTLPEAIRRAMLSMVESVKSSSSSCGS
jgi:hypothetical protein